LKTDVYIIESKDGALYGMICDIHRRLRCPGALGSASPRLTLQEGWKKSEHFRILAVVWGIAVKCIE
jgi:hypothetical protein